jgi:ATP-binding cassette, subfamily B, bacterial
MKKQNKQKSFLHIIANNLFILKVCFREAPYYSWRTLTNVARNRVIVFIEHIYMIGWVINSIIDKRPFWQVMVFITTVFVCVTLSENVWGLIVGNRIAPVARQKIYRAMRKELYLKAARLDLSCYDDPSFYNDFVWAMGEVSTRTDKVLETASNFIGHLVSIVVVGTYMFTQDIAGLFFVAVAFLGVLYFSARSNNLRLDLNERMKPHERKRDYISRILYLSDYAKEIRLNNIKGHIYKEFDRTVSHLDKEARKGTLRLSVYGFLINYVFNDLVVDGAYLLYLLYKTIVLKLIAYGTMVTLYNSCNQIKNSFINLSRSIPQFQENSLYIDKIRHFLDYEVTVKSPKLAAPAPKTIEQIELRNVSFSYEKSETLKNINLTIRKGEKIALVGYNGAGKTTLIKLLMRLYDPTSGQIIYGGHDIREYDLEEYHNVFQTVFQDYQLFAATVGENIIMDSLPLNSERAFHSARQSGFYDKLSALEQGYETALTREFDGNGAILSGGESQSLVITRALYKDSQVVILDEPSSALDPIAEYNLNRLMFELGSDKTVITISHRLSTTRMSDRIYMLENGEIIEYGTHEELMALGKKYAEMFTLQAEKYNIQNTQKPAIDILTV